MTVTSPVLAPAYLSQVAQSPAATQNLFEYMATQAQGLPAGASPAELGTRLLQSMDGFMDRVRTYGADVQGRSAGVAPKDGVKANPGEDQILRLIESLGKTFDYATEVAMVVRNTSGVSSSVNTLLRGQ